MRNDLDAAMYGCSDGGGRGRPPWMVTLADLGLLLLAFLLLLLSLAKVDMVKFRDALGSVRQAFGYRATAAEDDNLEVPAVDDTSAPMTTAEGIESAKAAAETAALNAELRKEIVKVLEQQKLDEVAHVSTQKRGLVIRVMDRLMFQPGSDQLSPASYAFLDEMVRLIDRLDLKILIEGHTDNTPIHARRFPSNWELSTSRAIAVLRYLIQAGGVDVKRLGSAGYADTRPIASNSTPAGRAQNGRIELVCRRHVDDTGGALFDP
jgi:chemotaxis protein MotB